MTFTNIPYGITYAVTEALPENDTYQHTLVVSDQGANKLTSFHGVTVAADTSISTLTATISGAGGTATGTINSEKDHVDITNDKNVTIDIGVLTEDAPFIALIAVAGAALVLLLARKRKAAEG